MNTFAGYKASSVIKTLKRILDKITYMGYLSFYK